MKRLFVVLLAVLASVAAEAQGRESAVSSTLNLIGPRRPVRSKVQLWVIGSSGVSRLSVPTAESNTINEAKNHDVYGGGILVEAGRFSFTGQTGVLYFQEGLNATETKTLGASAQSLRATGEMAFVGIPAVGRWNPLRRGRTRLSLGAGLMPAAVVSRRAQLDAEVRQNGVVTSQATATNENTDGIRKFNVMALASLGGDIGLNRNQDMRVEVQYRRSLMPITESESEIYSNSVVMNLGFGFDI